MSGKGRGGTLVGGKGDASAYASKTLAAALPQREASRAVRVITLIAHARVVLAQAQCASQSQLSLGSKPDVLQGHWPQFRTQPTWACTTEPYLISRTNVAGLECILIRLNA